MNEGERIDQTSPSEGGVSMRSKSYNFLLGLSRKLGNVATKSFVDVRHFLNQEVPLPSSERFFQSMPQILKLRHEDRKDIQYAKQAKSAEQLKRVVQQSQEILASANTVFPITLFPDTIFLDRTKVTIIRRSFFWSANVMSIRIQDILNVSVSVGPLFASLTVASRVMSTIDHFEVHNLWRSDAVHLKHIIQGYVITQNNKLDTSHLSKRELIQTLEDLGHDRNTSY